MARKLRLTTPWTALQSIRRPTSQTQAVIRARRVPINIATTFVVPTRRYSAYLLLPVSRSDARLEILTEPRLNWINFIPAEGHSAFPRSWEPIPTKPTTTVPLQLGGWAMDQPPSTKRSHKPFRLISRARIRRYYFSKYPVYKNRKVPSSTPMNASTLVTCKTPLPSGSSG